MVFQQKIKYQNRQKFPLSSKLFVSANPVFAKNKKAPPTSQRSFKLYRFNKKGWTVL